MKGMSVIYFSLFEMDVMLVLGLITMRSSIQTEYYFSVLRTS
jgi:hypothetical protein